MDWCNLKEWISPRLFDDRKRFVLTLSTWAWPPPAPSHQGIFEAFYCCVQCVKGKRFKLMSSSGFVDTELLLIVFAPCDPALYQSWHILWGMDGNCPSLVHGGIHLWGGNSGCLHFNLLLCFCLACSLPVISNSSVKRFERKYKLTRQDGFWMFLLEEKASLSAPPPTPQFSIKAHWGDSA